MPQATPVKWTREHLLVALNLYCKLPFGSFDKNNPVVKEVAAKMGRSAGSLAMKLSNLASFDPVHRARGVKGLEGASKLDLENGFGSFSRSLLWNKTSFRLRESRFVCPTNSQNRILNFFATIAKHFSKVSSLVIPAFQTEMFESSIDDESYSCQRHRRDIFVETSQKNPAPSGAAYSKNHFSLVLKR